MRRGVRSESFDYAQKRSEYAECRDIALRLRALSMALTARYNFHELNGKRVFLALGRRIKWIAFDLELLWLTLIGCC
jgi:hypothetical protein